MQRAIRQGVSGNRVSPDIGSAGSACVPPLWLGWVPLRLVALGCPGLIILDMFMSVLSSFDVFC